MPTISIRDLDSWLENPIYRWWVNLSMEEKENIKDTIKVINIISIGVTAFISLFAIGIDIMDNVRVKK